MEIGNMEKYFHSASVQHDQFCVIEYWNPDLPPFASQDCGDIFNGCYALSNFPNLISTEGLVDSLYHYKYPLDSNNDLLEWLSN